MASSLLTSFDDSEIGDLLSTLLVTYSKKSYEDLVVRLLRSPSLLRQLRDILTFHNSDSFSDDSNALAKRVKRKFSRPVGFFHTDQLVHDFLSAMFGLREIQHLRSRRNDHSNLTTPQPKKLPHLLVSR